MDPGTGLQALDIFGAQMWGDEATDATVIQLAEAGLRFVRLPLQWRWIEFVDADPPRYSWSSLDPALLRFKAAGIEPVAVLYTRPDWASSDGCGPVDRVPIARYQAYVRALVERYDGDGVEDAPGSPVIRYWEVENEQDFDPLESQGAMHYGSCFGGARAADYAEHLRATWLAAKAADPGATIIFGAPAYERFYNRPAGVPDGPFDYDFVGNALAWMQAEHGHEPGWPYFDRMGMHFYDDFRNNWDGGEAYDQGLPAKMRRFRDEQLYRPGVYDLRAMPIAFTEVGLASGPPDAWTDRDETIQARYPGIVLAQAKASGVSMLLWFMAKDRFTGDCGDIYAWQTFGLLRSALVQAAAETCAASPLPGYRAGVDAEPKPAMDAYRTAQAQLAGMAFETRLEPSLTGSARIEAYRFVHPQSGAQRIVAFTDNGERLGRRGSPPIALTMRFDERILPGWTGRLRQVDHRGRETQRSGATIDIQLGPAPLYLELD